MMSAGGLLPNVGTQLYAASWGMTEENGDISMTLKEVAVPFVNLDICNDADITKVVLKKKVCSVLDIPKEVSMSIKVIQAVPFLN